MKFSVMAKTIYSALKDRNNTTVEFIWHGGEPTLLPISFYEKALLVQSLFQGSNQTIVNLIQTNGTNFSHDWAEFVRKNHFVVGISLDGPPEIHDQYRKYSSGKPSFEDVARTIKFLRYHHIPFSVLMVIDEDALQCGPKRIFDFFVDMQITNYCLLAATPLNQPDALPGTFTHHYVTPQKMTNFLIELYDYWLAYADPEIKIREFDSIIQRIRGSSVYCAVAGDCFGHYYMIEPNGEVAHCELFVGDPKYSLGNILETDFNAISQSAELCRLVDHNKKQIEKMTECPEFSICNGWCPHERYLSERHDLNHKISCCGLTNLIDHIRRNMPRWVPNPKAQQNKELNTK